MQRLRHNLVDALSSSGVPHKVSERWGRIYVRAATPAALPVLARVFGISSYSLVDAVVPADLPTIVQCGTEIFTERVRGRRFAVRAHRVGQQPFRSHDVEVQLGAALLPEAARVDLSNPDVTVEVEVRDEDAYLFSVRQQAAGGLPLGVEGRALALISGGYDSAESTRIEHQGKRFLAVSYGSDAYGGGDQNR